MTGRATLPLVLAIVCGACASTPPPAPSVEPEWRSSMTDLEAQIRRDDAFDLHCVLASQNLTMINSGVPAAEQRAYAEKALIHADAAVGLEDDRVEGHYYRAVALGQVLERNYDVSRIKELEASGVRARELD